MTDPNGRPLFVDGTFPLGRPDCLTVIEAAAATNTTKEFFAVFDDMNFWGGPWGSEDGEMPRDLVMLRLVDWLVWTHKTPRSFAEHAWLVMHGPDFVRWLGERGATESARYMSELLALYPDSVPIRDELTRQLHMTAHEKANPDIWKDLRARYPALEDELADALRPWIGRESARLGAEANATRRRFAEPMPLTLAQVIETSASDAEFSSALITWLDAPLGHPALGFDAQPTVGRMLWVLNALATSLVVSGTAHFLLSYGVGKSFPKLPAWAKKIGAPTTVAYANAAIAELTRLNGGTLPGMGDRPRILAVQALEAEDGRTGGRGLFLDIDAQYEALVPAELGTRIRAWVAAHQAEVERDLLAAVATARA